jgi:hypothetical protein
MLLAALGEHFFWITSRAAGVAVLVASSAAVAAGLLMSGPARRRVPDLRAIHEALSLATLGALLLHALSLLGDEFLSPSLADIAVPFVSGYQRGWTSLGIVAGWMLRCSGCRTTPAVASAPLAGADCTAGRPSRGSSAPCTASPRERTPARCGSCSPCW